MQRISTKCQRFFWVIFRSSRPEVFFKRGVLWNFAKFTGNPPYWSLFLINLHANFQSAALFKKRDSSTGVFIGKRLLFKKETPAHAFSTGRLLVFFTISREISHYAFLSVGFFNKTLRMKIFDAIFAMLVAKE